MVVVVGVIMSVLSVWYKWFLLDQEDYWVVKRKKNHPELSPSLCAVLLIERLIARKLPVLAANLPVWILTQKKRIGNK